eukprot:SAG31_NODE_17655_length_662_cov_5.387211_1_plen_74_part_00
MKLDRDLLELYLLILNLVPGSKLKYCMPWRARALWGGLVHFNFNFLLSSIITYFNRRSQHKPFPRHYGTWGVS